MKKGFIIILLVCVVSYVGLIMQKNMKIDEKIGIILNTAYNNNYETDAKDYDHNKLEKSRLKAVEPLFTANGLEHIMRMKFLTESVGFIRTNKCNTSVESIELDIRETSNSKNKVCYYSIVVKIEFLNEIDDPVSIKLNGTISLYLENDEWLIGTILEDQYLYDSLDINDLLE